jgi:hypothetical protein
VTVDAAAVEREALRRGSPDNREAIVRAFVKAGPLPPEDQVKIARLLLSTAAMPEHAARERDELIAGILDYATLLRERGGAKNDE